MTAAVPFLRPGRRRRAALAIAFVVAAVSAPGPAVAQGDVDREAVLAELAGIEQQITLTEERQAELRAEIAALDRDRATLNTALIQTNQRVQELEAELGTIADRITELVSQEVALRQSLSARRDVMAQVLASLQRMGRNPAPAIIVQPSDALASVRSAILLGAVVPEMRAEAQVLLADLEELSAVRAGLEQERDRHLASADLLAEEIQRLELLIEQRQEATQDSTAALAEEQDRAAALALQAGSLEELIAGMGGGAARPPAIATAPAAPGPPVLLGEADRIAPAIPFASARGRLPKPVAGEITVGFGAPDGFGGTSAGISVATRPGARVSSPADGWVEFAGPYRNYRNLLIIDAGDDYRIVLSGMDRLDVQIGQFVLAGEPVGVMEVPRVASATAAAVGTGQPVLYLELRRGRVTIDPGPWWAVPY